MPFLRRLLPVILLATGLWLLSGCFYLPTPEHAERGQRGDVRKALGEANSKRPLRRGVATREQVVALLGPPPFASADRSSVAYLLKVEKGAWVYPLCLTTTADRARLYAFRLDFDADGVLRDWKSAFEERELPMFEGYVNVPPEGVIEKLQGAKRLLPLIDNGRRDNDR